MPLTTWTKSGAEENNSLYTGKYAAGSTYDKATLSQLAAQSDGYATIKVSAYVEDTTPQEQKAQTGAGHTAAWRAAINALSEADASETFTFAYDDTYNVANTTALESDDVKFYFAATTAATAPAISEASEKTNPVKSVTVNAQNLLSSYEDSSHLLQLGYLFVRAEGSLRAHTNGTAYVLPIKVS